MTAETSNARGETYTFDMIEDAWGDAVPLTKPYFDRFRARLETLRQQSAAPQPADARGDVRRLVALAEQMERDAAGCRRDGYTDAAVVKEDCAQRIRQTLGISAIAEALAQQPPSAPVGVDEAAAIRAFEEHFEASSDDPYFEGELELWLTAWRAALAQQPAAVDRARFRKAPCYLCGYNGVGYFQPETHPCAALYHAAPHQEPKS